MTRFKTAFAFVCGNGHQNLLDDRVRASSKQEAQRSSIENLKKTKCNWCDALATDRFEILGTEELPLHAVYWFLGYTCKCGERVKVLENEEGRQIDIPDKVTVSCSKGHSRTILNQEILSLERWTEQTQ